MPSPLDGPLAATIGKAFAKVFLPAVITADAPGSGPAYNPGPSTPTPHTCRALVDTWSAYDKSQGLVGVSDRRILVLAASLDIVPAEGMRIQVNGQPDVFRIYSDGKGQPAVSTDPATAVWVLRCRT